MAPRRLRRHVRGCNGFPVWELREGQGVLTCACRHVVRRPETLRKRLARVALGARVRRRLEAFWDGLK